MAERVQAVGLAPRPARLVACAAMLGPRPLPADAAHAVCAALQETHRAYHTLLHVQECLALLDAHRGLALRAAEVEFALWLHDAVYDPRAHDNEARSAQWAAALLADVQAPPAVAARVAALILATRHGAADADAATMSADDSTRAHADDPLPAQRDTQLLVDIDLAILGAPRARYRAYCEQVRREFAFVPDDAWRRGRGEVLAQFIARPQLYATAALHARLEAQARRNLTREASALAAA